MQLKVRRRAVIFGLVLFLHLLLARTAMTVHQASHADPDLDQARRWLQKRVIVIDPGHGGDDPGAVVGKTLEKKLVLQISQAVKEKLEAEGATVVLTRDKDKSLGGPIREELGRRVALVGEHKAQVFISIHANKESCYCWGAQTFYQRDGLPTGKLLADAVQSRLRSLTDTTRTALPANYFVLRQSSVASALVEVGFLTNARERELLSDSAHQQVLAKAIALGIADFFRAQVPEAEAGASIGR